MESLFHCSALWKQSESVDSRTQGCPDGRGTQGVQWVTECKTDDKHGTVNVTASRNFPECPVERGEEIDAFAMPFGGQRVETIVCGVG